MLTVELKSAARRLGFELTGVCPAVAPAGMTRFRDWLAAGYAGQMRYLPERAEAYEHPSSILDGVRSIVMLGMHYRTESPQPPTVGSGRVSRYAWGGADYHDVIHGRLKSLVQFLLEKRPAARARGVVDTAPLLEREFAQLAGLGWIGKNTMLINTRSGSYFFLAALLTDLELVYDNPQTADHCGTCTACLDACPTDAFPQPFQLDATRCISYLTIELSDSVPTELRAPSGDWLFGCDICQEVCPWNRKAPTSEVAEFAPDVDLNPVDLKQLFELNDEAFRVRFRRSPLWRPKRRGLLRNAAIVLGSQADSAAVVPLARGLDDVEPLVRGACAWALGRVATPSAIDALRARRDIEADAHVLDELSQALSSL